MKRITQSIIIGLGVVVSALTVALVCICPDAQQQALLPRLKMTFITLDNYRQAYGALPAEFGKFRRCPFVPEEMRAAPELDGFYYLSSVGKATEMVPLVVRPAKPHWFYQKICRRTQKMWVQYSDGHSELVELPFDATGFIPLADAILKRHAFSPKTAQTLRDRFLALEKMR